MSGVWLAIVIAGLLDVLVGEPSNRFHPIAWLGRLVGLFDRDWTVPTAVGLALACGLPTLVGAVVVLVVAASSAIATWLGVVVGGLVLFVTISLRSLIETARTVVRLSEPETDVARRRLRALAGRDPASLTPGQLRSAAVESTAENLADGLVGPLLAAVVLSPFGIAVAAGGASWVKTVNTLDSMVGYPDRRLGTASARLDDLVQWVPARLTAIALGGDRPGALRAQRAWLADVPSPNSGWPMGTIAAVVDCRLEKPGVYVLNPDAPLPTVATADGAIDRVARRGRLSLLVATVLALLGGVVL